MRPSLRTCSSGSGDEVICLLKSVDEAHGDIPIRLGQIVVNCVACVVQRLLARNYSFDCHGATERTRSRKRPK